MPARFEPGRPVRVAAARGLSTTQVLALIQANTDAADLGVFGDPGVNVLKLNLALDELTSQRPTGK